MIYKKQLDPCPMLQLTVFRREFLIEHDLKCIHGLRRQDSEFSPRALYYAKRVIPLHEQFYIYRIQATSVSSSARGGGYFLGDWAIILRSLLAFHAKVCKEPDFNQQISKCWGHKWLTWLFYFWFAPQNIDSTPRKRRLETLETLFKDGFGDFDLLMNTASPSQRISARWLRAFVRHSVPRVIVEFYFRLFFLLVKVIHH